MALFQSITTSRPQPKGPTYHFNSFLSHTHSVTTTTTTSTTGWVTLSSNGRNAYAATRTVNMMYTASVHPHPPPPIHDCLLWSLQQTIDLIYTGVILKPERGLEGWCSGYRNILVLNSPELDLAVTPRSLTLFTVTFLYNQVSCRKIK